MTSRRNKMLTHLMKGATGEMEETLMKLSIERICADMCDYYAKFYKLEGPGAMVFRPQEDDKESMFYLPVDSLINALDDNKGNEELEEVFQSAIRRAEALDPSKESLFLIQDAKELALVHYKHDTEGTGFMMF
jgi:hypothetical protein